MKKAFVLVSILSLALFAASVNFSGSWELDRNKSDLPDMGQGPGGRGFGGFVAPKMKVTQEANALTIERTMVGFDGNERTITTNTTLDGKVTKTSNERGESEVKAEWKDKALVIDTLRKFQGQMGSFESKRVETWTLSADGKELTIEFTQSSPRGDMKGKAVYVKK
ncbi:MAG: hypothetical protein ONB12_07625 [candidate division KSB1 bacterium]|nr:hypothetical protein [candidate division KSB1 bacterium]